MPSWKIDPLTGDLMVENNNIVFTSGQLEEAAQSIQSRLRTFRGEWFLDTNLGTPWYQEILKKNPNMSVVETELRTVIMETPFVAGLNQFSFELDSRLRTMSVVMQARILNDDGTLVDTNIIEGIQVEGV